MIGWADIGVVGADAPEPPSGSGLRWWWTNVTSSNSAASSIVLTPTGTSVWRTITW